MRSMTQAHLRAKWIRPPSLAELWLGALLRVLAMLVSAVAATFSMSPSRRARECDTPPAPAALPRRTRDITETKQAAASSRTTTQSQPTSAAAIAAIGCGGGCGDGGGDNALVFPPAESPIGPRSERGQMLHI
jgi:hypothetical protein